MRQARYPLVCGLLLAWGAAGACFGQNLDLTELLSRLRSNDFAVREKAQAELAKVPLEQIDSLEQALKGENDPEVTTRLQARVDEMYVYRITHPPRLSIDVTGATPQAVADAINKQAKAKLVTTQEAMGAGKPYTLKVVDQPLFEILRQLDQQSPLYMDRVQNPDPNEIYRSILRIDFSSRKGPTLLKTIDEAFAARPYVYGPVANGEWTLVLAGYADPRIRALQGGQIRIDTLKDQNGRDLRPLIKDLVKPIAAFFPENTMVAWMNQIKLLPAPGVTRLATFRGTVAVQLRDMATKAVDPADKSLAPIAMPGGQLTFERREDGGVRIILRNPELEKIQSQKRVGSGFSRDIDALGRFRVRTTTEGLKDGKPVTTTVDRTYEGGQGVTVAPGSKAEVLYIAKVREIVLPFEFKDVEVPANAPGTTSPYSVP